MRRPSYITILLLPVLLTALWGCAAPDSVTRLPMPESGISAIADNSAAPDEEAASVEEATPAEEWSAEEDTVPEPEITAAQEIKGLEALGAWTSGEPYDLEEATQYDFPITMNRQVAFYLDFFQNTQHDIFTRWLERSTRYLPMMKTELQKAGLPQDLVYLAMIESGFSLNAYSTAKAVGPWQFMDYTAHDYGLTVNRYVDERRDPEKATRAAVSLLSDLYAMFGDWYLAVAAYNAGGGTISKGIKSCETNDFWELAQQQYLNGETKRYVPKLIAAIIIAKNPEKYGFTNINYAPPLAYETVEVPALTPLRAVEVACQANLDELRELNRNLPLLVTPPDQDNYPLKVPVGQKELIARNLPRVKETVTTDFKTHVVDGNETLTRICKLYHINKTTLLKANNLRKSKLSRGQRLRIPYQITNYALVEKEIGQPVAKAPASRVVQYKVRRGDTLASIAAHHKVSVKLLMAWNSLKSAKQLKTGQQLTVHLEAKPAANTAMAKAESKSTIAKAETGKTKRPAAKPIYYEVRDGDTLWTIARRFDLTPDQLKQWNNLDDDRIQPGTRLQVNNPQTTDSLS